ncbi:hypothetical protein Cgig2_023040 [Carnegiea gigantea]|uniref:Uncharacterized protein n=1 Tax=Carnegiea gigantea TaxID=171969 RepID=A0A9Q1K8Q5_9CARY|nr:hypothetical protein Cgig2_023040 [Carnegiea gigantea]
MDKVQGVLLEILTNCSKLGTFKNTAGLSRTQPGDTNVGHQATPSSQDDGLFTSDPSFWDACDELAKTYEKTSGIACLRTFTPPGFDLGFGFRLSQSVQVERPNKTELLDGGAEFSSPKYKKFKHILNKGDPEQPAKTDQVMEYDPTKLRTRMSAYGLCSCLPSISDEQKRDITELRFTFLLTLRVDKILSRLARWLVENFDTCRAAVKFASNDELRISEDDVYLKMGFPRGSKPIQESKKSDKGEYTWLCYVICELCKKRMIGREFPILANLTSEDLWAQMNFELDSYQGFDKGIKDDRIKAPETPTLYIQEEEVDIRAKKTELLDGGAEFSGPKYKKFKHILNSEIQMTSWLDFSNSKLIEAKIKPIATQLEVAVKSKKIRSYRSISSDEIFKKWDRGLCELCDETYFAGRKCKKMGSNYLIVLVDEEENTTEYNSKANNLSSVNELQVFDKSPKKNTCIKSNEWLGKVAHDELDLKAQHEEQLNVQQLFDEIPGELGNRVGMIEKSIRMDKEEQNLHIGQDARVRAIMVEKTALVMISMIRWNPEEDTTRNLEAVTMVPYQLTNKILNFRVQ